MIIFVCPSKILHKHCFHFLLGLTIWSQEKIKAILMQNFGGINKEYYCIFESGVLTQVGNLTYLNSFEALNVCFLSLLTLFTRRFMKV